MSLSRFRLPRLGDKLEAKAEEAEAKFAEADKKHEKVVKIIKKKSNKNEK
jgi:hypothetical protein